jgi:hypothetical protein
VYATSKAMRILIRQDSEGAGDRDLFQNATLAFAKSTEENHENLVSGQPTELLVIVNYYYYYYNKVKVNLSLCLTKHHAMKTYWGVEV